MPFRTCPKCGANLDPCESCEDCKKEDTQARELVREPTESDEDSGEAT